MSDRFCSLGRQSFRRYWQPSRIVLGVLPASTSSGVNVITLCFNMHASYKPPMMAFAVHRRALSHMLIQNSSSCVLAVPGEDLAEEVMFCGSASGGRVDKVQECGFNLTESEFISVPGIGNCLGNIEVEIIARIPSGDHMMTLGRVLSYRIQENPSVKCLLSVGPDEDGYRVLARKGIHRLAVVDS